MKTKLAVAAVLMASASLPTAAQAAIITSNTPISVPNNAAGVYINFVTGATSTSASSTFDFNPYSNGSLLFYWGGDAGALNAGVANAAGVYQDLAAGTVISAASTFSQAAQDVAGTALFRTTGVHTLGFRFTNETTNAINYGYARIQTTGTTGFPATILNYSYENSGAAITVAAIPEPATWAMMIGGFGVAGSALRSRRRKAAASFA